MTTGFGTLFVLDRDRRPLMPAGFAQNRIAHGHSISLTHPVFNVIQLDRAYKNPSLQACYLAIRPRRRVAELFLVAEGTTREYPVLHVVVDLTVVRSPLPFGTSGPRQDPWPDPATYVHAVGDVITALQQFAPISHAAPIAPGAFSLQSTQTAEDCWMREVALGLVRQIGNAGLAMYWRPLENGYQPRKEALERVMESFVASPQRYASSFIARHGTWPSYPPLLREDPLSATSGHQQRVLHRGEEYCTAILEDGRVVPGIMDGRRTDARIRLMVPEVVAPTRVEWGCLPARNARRVSVDADGLVRFFRAVPIYGPQSHGLRRSAGLQSDI